MISVGIDVGGSSVKAAAFAQQNCLWTGQSAFYAKPSIEELKSAIRTAVGGRLSHIDAIGICVPGLLDMNRRIITLAVNVPGVMGISLDQLVPQTLGIPFTRTVSILNDAGATAHDIYNSRNLSGRLLVLTLGTGVGAAVLDEGVPLKVEGESPGHLGQIDVSIPGHEVIGPDGGAGGLEGYVGVAALKSKYGADVSASIAKFAGNEPAVQALVRAMRIAHAFYRPHHICLCGGIGIRLRHLISEIRMQTETNLTSIARPGWALTTGDLDFHAARGAAMLAASACA